MDIGRSAPSLLIGENNLNDNTNTFQSFIDTLAHETGIDSESATKVATWLKLEGVLDFPVINETYNEVN